MSTEKIIRTSEPNWLSQLAAAYRTKQAVVVVDDAQTGFDPTSQSLLEIGHQVSMSAREWASVLISLGMSGAGVWLIVAAILDPEPTSKLGLLITGGTTLILTGSFSAIRILTQLKPPSIEITKIGIRISW